MGKSIARAAGGLATYGVAYGLHLSLQADNQPAVWFCCFVLGGIGSLATVAFLEDL